MPDDVSLSIFRARLRYQEIQGYTGWDHLMINDYLGITEGTLALSSQIDENTLQISLNALNITDNSQQISGLFVRFGNLSSAVVKNANDISQNKIEISNNASKINDLEQLVNRVS